MEAMTLLHERDGRSFTLPALRRPRRLFVLEGRAWITQRLPEPAWRLSWPSMAPGRPAAPLADWWLAAGATMELPAGSGWIVQAEGDLRLALREAAPAPARRGVLSRLWRALAGGRRARPWTPASMAGSGWVQPR